MSLTLLIVDDEQLSRSYIRNMLLHYDQQLQVLEAASAKEAMRLFEANTPDVMFLDIKMRGTDGFGLLEQLPHREFELVFITAYNQYAINAIKEGATDYLLKPIKKSEFLAMLDRVIQKCNQRRDIRTRNEQYLQRLKEVETKLAAYVHNIKAQNRKIEALEAEIQQLQARNNDVDDKLGILEQLQRNAILTEEDWTNFKEMFENVHANFFSHLRDKYPDLTQAEIRLLALTKLGLPTREMAGMLGVSPETIRQTRWRVRKRLGLADDISLEAVVAGL